MSLSFSVVPHITDAIQEWVMRQALIPVDEDGLEPQVCVIEVCRVLLTLGGSCGGVRRTSSHLLSPSLPPAAAGQGRARSASRGVAARPPGFPVASLRPLTLRGSPGEAGGT